MAAAPTVLVLGGGGRRGALQVGVLRALAEVGFQPDASVGTSAGAVNAAVTAGLPLGEAAALLERVWLDHGRHGVYRLPLSELARNVAARRAWARHGAPLRELVRHVLDDLGRERFSDLARPLHVIVCNLLLGRTEVLHSGSLEDALVASCSIPGLFPPVAINGSMYVDGGVMENCGISVAARLRPAHIVAIDVSTEPVVTDIGGFVDIFDRVSGLGQQARARADFTLYNSTIPVTLLLPIPSRRISSRHSGDPDHLISAAADATRRLLPTLLGATGQLRPGAHEIPVELDEPARERAREVGSWWATPLRRRH